MKKMKLIQNKLDIIFSKAGQYNKYQFIIIILFTLQLTCSQFFHNNFSYLTSRPFIKINNTEIRIEPYICKKYFNDINSTNSIILREKQIPTTSIILDFKLYCDSMKTYLLSIFYYLGIIIGSFISYNFYDKVGTKLTISIFIPSQIICLIFFQFLNFDFLKNSIYFLYSNLFFLGMSEYIVINILLLYICDIVHLSYIPMFITIVISGRPISFLLGIFFFNILHLNWKTDLAIIAGVDIIIFILILKFMISSPKAALRNNKYVHFVQNLLKISEKNKKILIKEDFDFLLPFMNKKEINEFENLFLLHSKTIIDDDTINSDGIINNENNKDQKINNKNININEPLLVEIDNIGKEDNNLKEDYLLSDDNNKIGAIKSLIHETKMHDYSILDILKYKSLLIHFSILSFLWAVYNFIKYGLDSTAKEIPEYNNNILWVLCTHIIGLISLYLIMLIYISNKRAFHKLLLSIQLISFITLLIALHSDNININKHIYIFSIVIVQICWNCLYLLLILITILIYPIMLRSKGLGWNIGFGTIGKLVVMFLVDLSNEHEYILYFLLFDFLLLIFTYGLPNRIGSLVLDLNEEKEREREKEKEKKQKKEKEYLERISSGLDDFDKEEETLVIDKLN